jgi:hypothetical protein
MMVWNAADDVWMDDAALVPVKVDDMVAATWNDTHVVLVSGWSTSRNVEDVQLWERATNTWAAGTPVPGFGTFGAVGGICGDHIVFLDGVADTATFSFDLVNRVLVGTIDPLQPTDITWEDRGPHAGAPVYRGASWNIPGDDTRIVVAGGTDNPYNFDGQGYGGEPSEPLGQVFSYHVPTGTMVFHADKPVPTMDHRGFPFGDGRLWVVGGMEAGQAVTSRVSSWVPDAVTAVSPSAGATLLPVLSARPHPARARVTLAARSGEPLGEVRILDVGGREVRRLPGGSEVRWDLRDASGRRVPAGVYFALTRTGAGRAARSLVVREP